MEKQFYVQENHPYLLFCWAILPTHFKYWPCWMTTVSLPDKFRRLSVIWHSIELRIGRGDEREHVCTDTHTVPFTFICHLVSMQHYLHNIIVCSTLSHRYRLFRRNVVNLFPWWIRCLRKVTFDSLVYCDNEAEHPGERSMVQYHCGIGEQKICVWNNVSDRMMERRNKKGIIHLDVPIFDQIMLYRLWTLHSVRS